MTLPIVLAIAGSVALLVGLFGGGVKAKEIEVPTLARGPRILSGLLGIVLIGIAVWLSLPNRLVEEQPATSSAPLPEETASSMATSASPVVTDPVTDIPTNAPSIAQTMTASPSLAPVVLVPLYRYFNSYINDHYYTTDSNDPVAIELTYEGIVGYLYKEQQLWTTPLLKYHNGQTSQYFYSTQKELGEGAQGYKLEGILGYVFTDQQPNTIPLYRYFDSSNGSHFYTADFNELGNSQGPMQFELVQCYIFASSQ